MRMKKVLKDKKELRVYEKLKPFDTLIALQGGYSDSHPYNYAYMFALLSAGFKWEEASKFLNGRMSSSEFSRVIHKGCPRDVSIFELWRYDCISKEKLLECWRHGIVFVSELEAYRLRGDLSWLRVYLSRVLGLPISGCCSASLLVLACGFYGVDALSLLRGCKIGNEYLLYKRLYSFGSVLVNLRDGGMLFDLDSASSEISSKYVNGGDLYMTNVLMANNCIDALINGKGYSKEDYNHLLKMLYEFKGNFAADTYRYLIGKSMNLKEYMCSSMGTYVGRFFRDIIEASSNEITRWFVEKLNLCFPEMYVDADKLLECISDEYDAMNCLWDSLKSDRRCDYLRNVKLSELLKGVYAESFEKYIGITTYGELYVLRSIFTRTEDFYSFLCSVRGISYKGSRAVLYLMEKRKFGSNDCISYPLDIELDLVLSRKCMGAIKSLGICSYGSLVDYVEECNSRKKLSSAFNGLGKNDLNMICYVVGKLSLLEM